MADKILKKQPKAREKKREKKSGFILTRVKVGSVVCGTYLLVGWLHLPTVMLPPLRDGDHLYISKYIYMRLAQS